MDAGFVIHCFLSLDGDLSHLKLLGKGTEANTFKAALRSTLCDIPTKDNRPEYLDNLI